MRAFTFAAVAVVLCSATCARADTIDAFAFNSTLTDGYTAQGTVNVDVDDGQVQSSYFTLSQNGVVDAVFTQPDYSQPIGQNSYLAEFPDSQDGYTYELLLPDASLVGYNGGDVCTTTQPCYDGYPSGVFLPSGGDEVAVDGNLAPTPEPASLVMLATGLAAGFLFSRRRWT